MVRYSAPLALIALLSACSGSSGDDASNAARDGSDSEVSTDTSSAPALSRIRSGPELDAAFATAFPETQLENIAYAPSELLVGGDRLILISTGTAEQVHALGGFIAIHYLAREGDGFRVVDAWPQAIGGGSWGEPPSYTLRNGLLGPGIVIEARGGGTWQGYTCELATLVRLGEDGPETLAEQIPTFYDNRGALGEDEVEGAIVPGEDAQSIIVRYTGTFEGDVVYRLEDGALKADPNAENVPRC